MRSRRLYAFAASFLILSCASGAAAPTPRLAAPAPAQRSEPPPPVEKKEPSAYERRWASACTQPAALGRCPAPFDRPGVFIDAKGGSEFKPPALCGVGDETTDEAAHAALEPKRKALRACLRGAGHGAWIDVVSDGSRPANTSPGLPASAAKCVARVVKGAFPGTGPSSVKRVVVLGLGASSGTASTLSKESVTAMINAHADEVSACYDGALAVWPGLRGRMAPMVVVWFDGSVALVHTQESSLDNPALECCINTAVRNWQFGPPADGNIAIVSLPFVLGPRSEQQSQPQP